MSRKKAFTVSIRGRGRLLGMVVIDGMKAYPKSTWYDQSDAMKRAITLEKQIADSGYMRPDCVQMVRRAVANHKSPVPTDVVLHFASVGEVDSVKVVAGKLSRSYVLNRRATTLKDAYPQTVSQVVDGIGQLA